MGSDLFKDKKKKVPNFKPPTVLEVKTYIMAAEAKIKIYRQRVVTSIRKLRTEIANCLRSGNIEVAKAKMEIIIRNEDQITVYDALGPVLEILKGKVSFIFESQDCPPELHPDLDTLIFAGTRLEIEELHKLKQLLSVKYGDSYIMQAESNANHTVMEIIVAKLTVKRIPISLIIVRLKQLATEMNIECNLPSYDESIENPFCSSQGGNPFGPGGNQFGGNPFDQGNQFGGFGGNSFNQSGSNPYGSEFGGMGTGSQFDYMNQQQKNPGDPFGNFNDKANYLGGSNGPSNPSGDFSYKDYLEARQRTMNAPKDDPNNLASDPYKSNFMDPMNNQGFPSGNQGNNQGFGDNPYGNFDNNFNNPGNNSNNPNNGPGGLGF